MSTLNHALQLAALGLPCFPCGPSKAPACPGGYKAATTDANALASLWRAHPGNLIGMPTGPASGLDVLDIDPRHGGDAWEAEHRDRLPATRLHATRSGGRHYLFRHASGVRCSASKVAPGVDVRAGGGFVIWWPGAGLDVLCRAKAADWPAWLLRTIVTTPPAPTSAPTVRQGAISTEHVIRRALLRVETAQPGERHCRLRDAALTLGGVLDCWSISQAAATRALLEAVKRAGGGDVDERNALGTITWGLTKGAASPLSLRGRDGR